MKEKLNEAPQTDIRRNYLDFEIHIKFISG